MYLLLLLATAWAQTPAFPLWNPVWYSNFTETRTYAAYGVSEVTGVWYYNASLNISRMDRSSGRNDPFCGMNDWFMFFDTPCTHLINNGIRYMVYPQLQICCNCCSDSDGCGIIKPTWLNGAQYLGQYLYGTPAVESYLWNQMGNSNNFYWETVDPVPLNRVMLQLNNGGPDDEFIFPDGRFTDFPTNIFNVPTYCQSNIMCDDTSVCSEVRGSGGTSEYLKYLTI